jgi:hypothetical protein
MTISSLSSTSTDVFLTKLEGNGVSATKAQIVEDDLSQVMASAGSAATASAPVDMKAMRAALDKKIDEDVSSGKLSASDATAVKKTLDDMDAQAGTSGDTQTAATATAQSDGSGAAKSAGGGGGGGASTKTEVSETVTITGPLKTTIITYSDGSTVTSTTVASQADEQKYGKQATQATATSTSTSTAAATYLSTLPPGTLFSQMA